MSLVFQLCISPYQRPEHDSRVCGLLCHLSPAASLLDTSGEVLPLVVSVSGRVGSDIPISCEHSGLRGVIVEETVIFSSK